MPNPRTNRIRLHAVATLVIIALLLGACGGGPVRTPVVIQEFSRENTLTAAARPSLTPTGPSPTPTQTSTPYIRPTDPSSLGESQVIVRVGAESITLGDFRARVRYERFAALEDVRRTVTALGLKAFNFMRIGQTPSPAESQVAGVFNTLSNSGAFGLQIYTVMVREAILRQEFASRKLKLGDTDVRDYWIRHFGLQRDPDRATNIVPIVDAYLAEANRYSGLTADQINQIAATYEMGVMLRPIIAKERVSLPDVATYHLKRILTQSQADANAALAALQQGKDFRAVACQYSTEAAVRGNGGDLGFVARGAAALPIDNFDPLLKADVGTVLGPLSSAVGWYVVKVNAKRRTADNTDEVSVQAINVSTQALATEIKTRAEQGEAFGGLACAYSLGNSAGNGGDFGFIGESQLDKTLVAILQNATENQIVGPIQTQQGYEVVQFLERKVNLPKPEDVDSLTTKAFVAWQNERESSAFVQSLTDAWKQAIPGDPFPRDVAPFLSEENFGLPTPVPTPTNSR